MRTFSRGIVSAFFSVCGFILLSSALFAQAAGSSGSVSGTVTDPTGAIVPGATVEIYNPVSKYQRTAATDKAGHFQFPNLPFNEYHLTVTMTGFSNTSQDVDVASVVPVTENIALKVGDAANTTVVVTGEDLVEN